MRICLICHEYPPDTVGGGIGTYTANISRGLAGAGHRVHVIARAVRGVETTSRDGGVVVHRIRPAKVPRASKTFADAYLYSRAAAARVRGILGAEGLDIIQSPEHGAEGFAVATDGIRLPHVVRFHTPLFMVNQAVGNRLSLGARIVHLMERTTARKAVLNTSASRALAEVVAARFGIPTERIRVVPNAIDHETFCPAATVPAHPPTVLYVGKVAPLKGASTLAEAIPMIVRQVPGVRVLLIGSDHIVPGRGSTREEMLARLRSSGAAGQVTFMAPVERSRLVELYREADVCVLPTLWDNFPNTCLESMACGTPVVASAVGGLPEIIDNGRSGILVPPSDATRLAEAVTALLDRPEERREMGRAARQKILDTYTRARIVAATVEAYTEAIARFSTRVPAG